MKPPVSPELRRHVLALRRTHTFSEVAKSTHLPLGTVKTICSRSGAFRDNLKLRKLFALPPVKQSNETLPSVAFMPERKAVTGDTEIDAMIWLQEVVKTGQANLINKALEAAKRITTPVKDLQDRYMKHLDSTNPSNGFRNMFAVINFGELENLGERAVKRHLLRNEATARFGNSLFEDTPAEAWCAEVVKGVVCGENDFTLPDDVCRKLFSEQTEYLPHTLSDCLYELRYWNELSWLRDSHGGGDNSLQVNARDSFIFWSLSQIRPRSKTEAIAVLHYMSENDAMDRTETNDILLNLIGR